MRSQGKHLRINASSEKKTKELEIAIRIGKMKIVLYTVLKTRKGMDFSQN